MRQCVLKKKREYKGEPELTAELIENVQRKVQSVSVRHCVINAGYQPK